MYSTGPIPPGALSYKTYEEALRHWRDRPKVPLPKRETGGSSPGGGDGFPSRRGAGDQRRRPEKEDQPTQTGSGGKKYFVTVTLGEPEKGSCTCLGYVHTGKPCKHIAYAALCKAMSAPAPSELPSRPAGKALASVAEARGRAVLEPESGPGREVAFRPDGGSPSRALLEGETREGSGTRARRAVTRASETATASGVGGVLQLEDAPGIAVPQQPHDTGCWAILKGLRSGRQSRAMGR